MAHRIKPKRSTTSGVNGVPTTDNLEAGEIAINLVDKKLFVRDTSDSILELTTRTISALDDTTITATPAEGDTLVYDSALGVWVNKAPKVLSLDSAVAIDLDFTRYSNFLVALTSNKTFTATITEACVGMTGTIVLTQDGIGGRVITLPAVFMTPNGGAAIDQVVVELSVSAINYFIASTDKILINYLGDFK
jgi:hypothetical protein